MDGYRGNDDLMCTEASFGLAQENPQVQNLYLGAFILPIRDGGNFSVQLLSRDEC